MNLHVLAICRGKMISRIEYRCCIVVIVGSRYSALVQYDRTARCQSCCLERLLELWEFDIWQFTERNSRFVSFLLIGQLSSVLKTRSRTVSLQRARVFSSGPERQVVRSRSVDG